MNLDRQEKIERLAAKGKLKELKELFQSGYTQLEIDIALENAIAYSQLKVADFLLKLGADFANYDYQGVYYAVHNNEFEGLKYAISKGVDININKGIILNTSIIIATNYKSCEMTKWIISNGANPSLLTENSLQIVEKYGSDELKQLINNFLSY